MNLGVGQSVPIVVYVAVLEYVIGSLVGLPWHSFCADYVIKSCVLQTSFPIEVVELSLALYTLTISFT